MRFILASKSPRRQELLKQMGLDFRVVLKDVDESYPEGLNPAETALYIAEKKADAFSDFERDEAIITADTIVCIEDTILGKPQNSEEAFEMLSLLSGRKHEVITGVCLRGHTRKRSFYERTEVYFNTLSHSEINYYIENYKPFDKAGAYGIQEWIGLTGINKIIGSYSNVVGLPTQRLYEELKAFQ